MLTILSCLILIFLIIIAATLTELEKFGSAAIIFIFSIYVLHWLHEFNLIGFDLWTFVVEHKSYSGLFMLTYIIIGILWSFGKWASYLYKFKEKFLEEKKKFIKNNQLPTDTILDEAFFKEWQSKIRYGVFDFNLYLRHRPLATHNKDKIIFWMSLWPISFLGTFVNDPVRRFFNWCFRSLKLIYQSISNYIFKDLQDLK